MSAAALGGLGMATLPLVRVRREVPFALLTLGFGMHQGLEGIIWTELDASGGAGVRSLAVNLWIAYAWVVLPVLLPVAVRLLEPAATRRRAMLVPLVLGIATSAYLAVTSVLTPVVASAAQRHIDYQIPIHPGWLVSIPYVLATCGSSLMSTRRYVSLWGAALTVGMAITAARDAKGFSSSWCFVAAWLGIGVFGHFASEAWRARRAPDIVPAA